MSPGAGRVRRRVTSTSRRYSALAVELERLCRARAARRGTATPPGADARANAVGDRVGLRGADERDVDELVAVALGARARARARSRSGRGSRTHTASTPRAWAAAIAQQAARPGADDEQRVARRAAPRAVRTRAARRRAARRTSPRSASSPSSGSSSPTSSAGTRTRSAKPPGSSAGRAEALAQRLVAAAAAPALAARRVVVDDDAVAGGDGRRPRRRRPTTSPASSCPSTAGSLRATHASLTSEPQTPQASTRQTTSPGPRLGLGRRPRCGPRAA